MNNQAFFKSYNASRNGANCFYRHFFIKKFHYSDGVSDCAEAGCACLIDIAATEIPAIMRSKNEPHCMFEVSVKDSKTLLKLTYDDDRPPLW
jgi:hypothetical protein